MYSCFRAIRLTFELMERHLSATERLDRWSHLLLCRHCRAHSRQIYGLHFVLKSQNGVANISLPSLSPAARARIAAAIVKDNPQ
jgi:hypothetical protein